VFFVFLCSCGVVVFCVTLASLKKRKKEKKEKKKKRKKEKKKNKKRKRVLVVRILGPRDVH
jgi:Na+/melibiose symporter-like transporter